MFAIIEISKEAPTGDVAKFVLMFDLAVSLKKSNSKLSSSISGQTSTTSGMALVMLYVREDMESVCPDDLSPVEPEQEVSPIVIAIIPKYNMLLFMALIFMLNIKKRGAVRHPRFI